MTAEQKVQLLSEPALVAIGDLLGVEERKKDTTTYYTAILAVGTSTERFELEAVDAGKLQTVRKYTRVYVSFQEFTFRQSGMTVKRAKTVIVESA